jgi:hypothetical protein
MEREPAGRLVNCTLLGPEGPDLTAARQVKDETHRTLSRRHNSPAEGVPPVL